MRQSWPPASLASPPPGRTVTRSVPAGSWVGAEDRLGQRQSRRAGRQESTPPQLQAGPRPSQSRPRPAEMNLALPAAGPQFPCPAWGAAATAGQPPLARRGQARPPVPPLSGADQRSRAGSSASPDRQGAPPGGSVIARKAVVKIGRRRGWQKPWPAACVDVRREMASDKIAAWARDSYGERRPSPRASSPPYNPARQPT
jgi:hypothetical protein